MTEQEKSALAEALLTINKEFKSRQRNRRIFFWIFFLFFIFGIVSAIMNKTPAAGTVAVVEINGVISADSKANSHSVIKRLKEASEDPATKAIILDINSPGGSPVQSAQIFRKLRSLHKEKPELPIYAVINDVGASGAYFIAVGAQKSSADPATLVGSIGGIVNFVGCQETFQKLGLEPRTFKSGRFKDILSGTRPIEPEEAKLVQDSLDEIHKQFIAAVKEGRGSKLKEDDNTFSGLFWTGEKAKALGLVDELSSLEELVAKEFPDMKIRHYKGELPLLQELQSASAQALGQAVKQNLQGSNLELR